MARGMTPLYVGTNRHVAALDPQSGEELWRVKLPHGGTPIVAILIGDKRLFIGHAGYVYALDRQAGAVLWENGLPGMGFRPVMLASDFTAARQPQPLYIATNRWVAALDRGTGTELWRSRLPHGGSGVAEFTLKKGRLFVGYGGYGYCLDARSGELLWENGLPGMGYYPVMPVMEGAVASTSAAPGAAYQIERRRRAAAAGAAAS
jgi:outer membrane protein assembly factor BamB